jgi:hypothetical protein
MCLRIKFCNHQRPRRAKLLKSLYPLYTYTASLTHRVGRVLSFLSSRRNCDSPTPLAAGECARHPLVGGGGKHTRFWERDWGSPNSDAWTHTVVLYIYKNFVALLFSVCGPGSRFYCYENLEEHVTFKYGKKIKCKLKNELRAIE